MKTLLRILGLVIVLITVTAAGVLVFIFDTEGGLHWVSAQLIGHVPGRVSYESLHGSLSNQLSIRNLHYETDLDSYNIENLEIRLQLKDLMRGSLHIIAIEGDGIDYVNKKDVSPSNPPSPAALTSTSNVPKLPLSITLDKLAVRRISILFKDPRSRESQRPFIVNQITSKSITLGRSLAVDELQATTAEYMLTISGTVDIADNFPVNLQTSWRAAIPGNTTVIGNGDIKGDMQSMTLNQAVEKPFSGQIHGSITNILNSAQQQIKLSAMWHDFNWPVDTSPLISSHQGDLQLEGNPDDYQFSLSASLGKTMQIPSGELSVNGEGSRHEIQFTRITGHTLGGSFNSKGNLEWQSQLVWQFELDGEDIDPAQQWSDWPGSISFSAAIDGELRSQGLVTTVEMQKASGEIRGFPLATQGKMTWKPEGITVSNLKINSGNNTIIADGSLTDRWELNWNVDATEIQTLIPHLSGTVLGKGKIRGLKNAPHLTLAAQARQLAYDNNTVASLDVSADIDMSSTQPSIINLESGNIRLGGQNLDAVEMQAVGKVDSHNLQARLQSGHTTAVASMDAALHDHQWAGMLSTAKLTSTRFGTWNLESPVHYSVNTSMINLDSACWQNLPAKICTDIHWQQDKGGAATLMADTIPLGILMGELPADLEIGGTFNARGNFSISADNYVLGSMQLRTSKGQLSNTLSSGSHITVDYSDASALVEFARDHISASGIVNINDENSIKTSISLPQTTVNIGSGLNLDNVPITGDLRVRLSDLDLIPYFIPDVENTTGEINIDFTLDGTTSQPKLKGMAQLTKGSAEIPGAGLNLNNIRITVSGDAIDNLKITSKAESGKGTIAVNGSFGWDSEDKIKAQIAIKGEQFEVVNIPNVRISASPDLAIEILHRRVDINGSINIPAADIHPGDLTLSQTPSADVIIETGEKQIEEERWQIYSVVNIILGQQVNFDGFGLTGNIDGNVAIIDSPGQLTTAYGQLQINNGVYVLQINKSLLKAYKLKLDIKKGQLLFVGGPIDNPGLDIVATRQIKNANTNVDVGSTTRQIGDITANVDIRGTLQNPLPPRVSCVPAMTDTDCVSYLVLGFPMSQATQSEGEALYGASTSIVMAGGELAAKQIGKAFAIDEVHIDSGNTPEEATLVVGKYLSARLYVGYGIGLIEPINTFIMRYKINSKWSMQTESGYNTGADLFYTLEK